MSDQHLVDTLRSALSTRQEVFACAYLFGSRARGNSTSDSDVDIALLFMKTHPTRSLVCTWTWQTACPALCLDPWIWWSSTARRRT